MKFDQPSTGGGGGGGGAFSTITGTPTEVAYFDSTGHGTSDSMFIRNPNDNFYTKELADTQAFGLTDYNNNSYSFQAVEHGVIGNSIILTFNGTDDVDTVVATWNTANPTNTVALILGTGTDVLPAQTLQLSGGGVTGLQVGHHDIFGIQQDGTAVYTLDRTSGAFAGSVFGDNSFVGISGLSSITGYVDFPGNTFGVLITSKDNVALNYNSPTGGGEINISSDETRISSGNNYGYTMSDNDSIVGWFTPTYNAYFPSTATPGLGDTLQVTSNSGNDYYFSWAPAGTSAAGLDTWVQYNNSGVLGADADFLFDNTNKILNVGDRNKTMLVIDNQSGTTGFVMGAGNNAYFTVKDRNTTLDSLYIDTGKYSVILGNASSVGTVDGANEISLVVNNKGRTVDITGLAKNTRTAITFAGSGLNDLSTNPDQFYTGNNVYGGYTVEITHVDTQQVYITSVVGTPTVGDVVTGLTSGATGTVFQTDGATYLFLENITGGPFSPTEALTAVLPATWTAATIAATPMGDFVHIDNGPNASDQFTFSVGSYMQGITPIFASPLGHTLGDSWGWNYTVTYGHMAVFNGSPASGVTVLGDVDNLYGGSSGNNNVLIDTIQGFTTYGGGHIDKVSYVASSSYTVGLDEHIVDVRVNSIGSAPDIYLPEIDFSGRTLVITDEDGNSSNYPITIHAYAGQLFNTIGTGTLVLNTDFQSVTIHANVSGNTWIVT